MNKNEYQREHQQALRIIRQAGNLPDLLAKFKLNDKLDEYLAFRQQVKAFLQTYFSRICTVNCFQNHLSACCGRESIIAFFGDMAVNALLSSPQETESMFMVLDKPHQGDKCVYLGTDGCIWRMKPLVCEMFLCAAAEKSVFAHNPDTETRWADFRSQTKYFTWPDHPALFDLLEVCFIDQGLTSPLMYCHTSPGLIMLKKQAGLADKGLQELLKT